MDRYMRNQAALTPEENQLLSNKRVCVVGCGGLGGYVIEMLARIGIGHLTVVDSDVFEKSNWNRQILSEEGNLGKSKALAARDRIQQINSEISLRAVEAFLDEKTGKEILENHDLVVDALDSLTSRLILGALCKELNLPLVHGAIAGWYGQVTSIFPGDDSLDKIYRRSLSKGIEKNLGNLSFTPALIAALQVSETVKILLGRGDLLRKQLLFVDLLNNEFVKIDMEKT